MVTPLDIPRSVLYGHYNGFLHIKHNRGEKKLTEGALMGDRFLHMDV
jgi:hypothetical protein